MVSGRKLDQVIFKSSKVKKFYLLFKQLGMTNKNNSGQTEYATQVFDQIQLSFFVDIQKLIAVKT